MYKLVNVHWFLFSFTVINSFYISNCLDIYGKSTGKRISTKTDKHLTFIIVHVPSKFSKNDFYYDTSQVRRHL